MTDTELYRLTARITTAYFANPHHALADRDEVERVVYAALSSCVEGTVAALSEIE